LRSSSEEEPHIWSKGGRRPSINSNEFRVEILEFEGKLNPNEFVEWLTIVE